MPLFAITNFSADFWPPFAEREHAFFSRFRDSRSSRSVMNQAGPRPSFLSISTRFASSSNWGSVKTPESAARPGASLDAPVTPKSSASIAFALIALAPLVGDHYHLMHEAVGITAFFGGLGFLWWGVKSVIRKRAPDGGAA